MILPILKTLSLSFVTLAAVAPPPASGEKPTLHLSKEPIEAVRHATPSDDDRGWEYRLDLIEARPEANVIDPLSLRGAIIVPPFRAFVPYRRHGAPLPEYSETRETPLAKN